MRVQTDIAHHETFIVPSITELQLRKKHFARRRMIACWLLLLAAFAMVFVGCHHHAEMDEYMWTRYQQGVAWMEMERAKDSGGDLILQEAR